MEVRTETGFRAAHAALIDQDQVTVGGIGVTRLEAGVDRQRCPGSAADVDDGIGQGGLQCALNDDDREGEGRAVWMGMVTRHAHHAATQAGQNVADVRQITTRRRLKARI